MIHEQRTSKKHIREAIARFPSLKVAVIGDMMLDGYLHGSSSRICREAPVPIVDVRKPVESAGGAGNTAVNLRTLGAEVHLVSVGGKDYEGETLLELFSLYGIHTNGILLDPGRKTISKYRVVSDSQLLVRFDRGSKSDVSDKLERRFNKKITEVFSYCDAIVLSDYGYGMLTSGIIEHIRSLQRKYQRVIVCDAKDLPRYRDVEVTAVKPNYGEAISLLKIPPRRGESRVVQLHEHGPRILEMTGARIAALTLDADGGLILESGKEPYRIYAEPQEHSKAAGAGDTFVSALTLSLAAGTSTSAAAEIANAAAGVVVHKDGTSVVHWDELSQMFSDKGKRVSGFAEMQSILSSYRQQGKRIVFTNGYFDVLKRQHIAFLHAAKARGDILVVGVNSDLSSRNIQRAVNSERDRLHIVGALEDVDHVILFDQASPRDLLRVVKPDVYVKGGDYTRAGIPEASLVEEYGGTVEILPYITETDATTGGAGYPFSIQSP